MYGLIGKPLGHSFSATYFNDKFHREGIKEQYNLFPLESIKEFPELMKSEPSLKGLNVTIPYKQEILPFLDYISDEAKQIGAVNVVKIIRDGYNIRTKGFNSDVIGFEESLKPEINPDIKNALVLGTGGASKAVVFVLNKLGIRPTLVSRNPKDGQIGYEDISEKIINDNLLIVNTTPLGMSPEINACPPIPYQWITDRHVAFDLIYNPEETLFLKKAKKQGAKTVNGLKMLYLQAEGAWAIWNS